MTVSAPADSFFVYIVRCIDDSLYVGHTSDVEDRIKTHNDGRAALWTASRIPVTLVYQEIHPSEVKAIARERQIKRWTRDNKLALIRGDKTALQLRHDLRRVCLTASCRVYWTSPASVQTFIGLD
jgi:putative endonuclease